MRRRRSAATAGCWPWARTGAWCSGTWPAARSSPFLPIGNAWHLMFEASGDLITSGSIGVQRWPIQLDPDRGEFRIGPPRQLPLPAGLAGLPRTDRAGSWPWPTVTMPTSRPRSGRSGWGRWTTAAMSPSARTGNGWRPAATARRCPGLAHPRRHEGGRSAHRWGHRGSLQPRWEMADDAAIHRAGSGRSAPGARCGGSAATGSASPPTAGWWSSWTRTRSFAWSRPRPAARSRGSRAPTCAAWRGRPSAPTGRAWW